MLEPTFEMDVLVDRTSCEPLHNTAEKTKEGKRRDAHGLACICKKPAEFTALNRLRSDINAELCGSSIRSPYRHLKR
jgi:hypothetical protein